MIVGMTLHEVEQLLSKCGIQSLNIRRERGGYVAIASCGSSVLIAGPSESLQQAIDSVIDEVLALTAPNEGAQ